PTFDRFVLLTLSALRTTGRRTVATLLRTRQPREPPLLTSLLTPVRLRHPRTYPPRTFLEVFSLTTCRTQDTEKHSFSPHSRSLRLTCVTGGTPPPVGRPSRSARFDRAFT